MKVLVTGATGFIGGHVARAAVRHGYDTRVLLRPESDRRNLEGLDAELIMGDLREPDSLTRAVRGCDAVLHVAAAYTYWTRHPERVYDTNVEGTRRLIDAACEAGVERVVYTSSESTVGIDPATGLGSEAFFRDPQQLHEAYKHSKYLAEQLVLERCQGGLDAVVVNPTTPIGTHDLKPTPTGQVVVRFMTGHMPAYVDTGLNIVDVEDVAEGHILALEKGRSGERYLLGNKNLTFRQILETLGRVTGRRAPRFRLPFWLVLGAAHVNEFIADRTGRPPAIPVAGVHAAGTYRHFDCSKALRELGLPQTPVEEAFRKAARWFTAHGYVPADS